MEILETKERKMNKIKREERENLHTFSDTTEELSGLNSHKSSNIHIQYIAIYEADKAQVNETL